MNATRRNFIRAVAVGVAASQSGAAEPEVRIDAGYPGGNILVQKVERDSAYVAPDLRDTQKGQWWFYWNFRLRAPAGRHVRIVFTDRNPIGVRGPAVSSDGGATWSWLGPQTVRTMKVGERTEFSFEARVPEGRDEVRYAFCIPYVGSHLKTFLDRHRDDPALRVEELCRSRKGRPVELLRAGCLDRDRSKGVVLLTSRHHACEALATYALEGFLEAVLAKDALGERWRSTWEVLAIPFMDRDGVEDGDQGKNRTPHDHNRDYNERPLYPEVSALMKLGESLKPRILTATDLHCPHIRGEWNDRVYLVGAEDKGFWEKQQAFARVLEKVQTGPIVFRARDCLAFGQGWNTKGNFSQGRSNSTWARDTFADARLVGTMEIAYADALGKEVNADSARALGRDLARATAEVLSG